MSALNNIRIGPRLMLGIGAILVLAVAAIGGAALRQLDQAVERAEHAELTSLFESAKASIDAEARLSSALAALAGGLPAAQAAMAQGDRDALQAMFGAPFDMLKAQYGTEQFQFHTAPATSFLRLHKSAQFGDDLSSFRKTVVAASLEKRPISGLEAGVAGLGIRGVVPVVHGGSQVGTVEFGMELGKGFFDRFKATFGSDVAFYQASTNGVQARGGTMDTIDAPDAVMLARALADTAPLIGVRDRAGAERAILLGRLTDYAGNPVGILEVAIAHAPYRALIDRTRSVALLIGLLALGLGLALAYALTRSITAPLRAAGTLVEEIGAGHLSARVQIDSRDEIGDLAREMNRFADHLQRDVCGSMVRLSRGDLAIDVIPHDDRDEITPVVLRMRDSLTGLVKDTDGLIHSARAGDLKARADTTQYEGAYRNLLDDINQLLDVVVAPIDEAAATLERIAARDLRSRMAGEYRGDHAKIKTALNTTAENLDSALAQVAAAAEQVSAAGTQITAGSQSLAQGASEQASSLEEVSSSLQELASMARQSAQNAREARGLSTGARESTVAGMAGMTRLSDAIGRIKQSSDQTARIVKTIDEIAFQTNLLALNAAVEAARAGDAGKGFAVVADEVRALAIRAADAARNTAALIEESVQNADGGVTLNAEVLAQLEEINGRIDQLGSVMAEIAEASDQQHQGVDQINKAVEQLNGVTQQVAANAEESASAAEELGGQATALRELVGAFQLTTGPSAGHNGVVAATSPGRHRTANGQARNRNGNGNGHRKPPAGQVSRIHPPAGGANGRTRNQPGMIPPSRIIPFDDDETLGSF